VSDDLKYVACPGCKSLAFEVLHDAKTMQARVLCSGCKRELMNVQMAPADEPVRVPI
jgi:hypothetical protein